MRVMPDDIFVLSHSDVLDLSHAFQDGCEPDINIILFISRACEHQD